MISIKLVVGMLLLSLMIATGTIASAQEKHTLSNGLRVILKQNPTSPVIAIQTFVRTGVLLEPPEQLGISDLTQRLLLKGTETKTEDEIFEGIENLGVRIGTGLLPDMTNLSLQATRETLDEALPIYIDVLLHPSFPEREVDRVKDQMIRELQAQQDNFFTVIWDNLRQGLYGDFPYALTPTEETVRNISRETVVRFYRDHYVPNNMVVVATGDFEAEAMLKRLQQAFGELEPGELPLRARVADVLIRDLPPLSPKENVEISVERESQVAWMMLGYLGPTVADPDYPAMKLLNTVLGEGLSSRLFVELREKRPLAYQVGSFFPSRMANSHFLTYIITPAEAVDQARDGILAVLDEVRQSGVTAEDLDRSKNFLAGNYVMAHETTERQAWYLGWWEMLGAGFEMDQLYPERIRTLNSEDLQEAAKRYFDHYVVSILKPPE
ncbi:MAG: M16 family metallopeptidase [Candidatus Bipolaricaulia bacterium]